MEMSDESKKTTLREKLHSKQQRTSREREQESASATKRELEFLEKARATPVREMHLRPGGEVEKEIHRSVQKALEGRIDLIREKLDLAKNRMEKDFSANKSKGRVKDDFDRSR